MSKVPQVRKIYGGMGEDTKVYWEGMIETLRKNLYGYLEEEGLLEKKSTALTVAWEWKEILGRVYQFSPQQLVDEGIAYFQMSADTLMPITLSGLALYLKTNNVGLKKIASLDLLKFERPLAERIKAYRYIVYQFRAFVELFYEMDAHLKLNPTFNIFALKNLGWVDRVEVEEPEKNKRVLDDAALLKIRTQIRNLNLVKNKDFSTANLGPEVSSKSENFILGND